MLGALFVVLIVGCVVTIALFAMMMLAVKLFVGLVLLPFRLLGWILFIPLLIIKTVLGLIAGLIVLPVLAIAGIIAFVAAIAAVAVPLLPFAAIALLIWIIVKASSRPATV